MSVDYSKLALIFASSRATQPRQLEALMAAAGDCRVVYIPKQVKSWRTAVRSLRDGDTVYIYALALVPTKRGGDKLTPSAQVAAFMLECIERGAVIVEVYTGRTSKVKRDRDGMIADALQALRVGPRQLPDIGSGPGRKRKQWPPGTEAKAKEIWRSRDYRTRQAAEKHIEALHADITSTLVRSLGPWQGRKT